jgi:type 1 glutamine amidotransferase
LLGFYLSTFHSILAWIKLMKASFAILLCFFVFAKAKAEKPTIVFLLAEREYQTDETLPSFAKESLGKKFQIKYCKADDNGPGRHILKNAKVIASADLLFVSVRRRAFTSKTMGLIRKHIVDGKPVLGIRTSSHAFALRKETLTKGHETWDEWDKEIIGGNYDGHHGGGKACRVDRFPSDTDHPILKDLKFPFETTASLYRNSPLPAKSVPLLRGTIEGFPSEPVAWTHRSPSGGKVFYTSLGHVEDFKKPAFDKLLLNAIKWCLDKK